MKQKVINGQFSPVDALKKNREKLPTILIYSDYHEAGTGYGKILSSLLQNLLRHFNIIEFGIGAHDYDAIKYMQTEGFDLLPNMDNDNNFKNNEYYGQTLLNKFLKQHKEVTKGKDEEQVKAIFCVHDNKGQVVAANASKNNNIPLIAWVLHDNDNVQIDEINDLDQAAKIIFMTEYAKRVITNKAPWLKGNVVYPAINMEKSDPLFSFRPDFIEYLKTKRIIFFNGKNQARKNLECLLKAAKIIQKRGNDKDLLFLIHSPFMQEEFGGRPQGRMNDESIVIQELMDSLGIKYPGYIEVSSKPMDYKAISAIYGMAELYVNTSTSEGFGITFLEAFHHGVYCIGVDYSATSEVLAEGRGSLITPKIKILVPEKKSIWAYADPLDIADEIELLMRIGSDQLDNVGDYLAHMKEAQKKFIETYNTASQAEKLATEIKEVIENEEIYKNKMPVQVII